MDETNILFDQPSEDGLYYYRSKDGKGWLGKFKSPVTENREDYDQITPAEWNAHIAEMEEAERQARIAAEEAEAATKRAEEEAYNSPEAVKARRISELKALLASTDYYAIKYVEGWISEEEYAPIKAQRQRWRDEINSLEAEYEE